MLDRLGRWVYIFVILAVSDYKARVIAGFFICCQPILGRRVPVPAPLLLAIAA